MTPVKPAHGIVAALSAFVLPGSGKTHKDTYPNARREVRAAVKNTLANPENYTVRMANEARMAASYAMNAPRI